MAEHKIHQVGDDVPFWAAANDTGGSGADADSGDFNYDVRKFGDAANAEPKASGTGSLLSHANYPAGLYEVSIDTDGWDAGVYSVFATLLVDSENPSGFLGSFKLVATGTDIHSIAADWADGGRLDLLLDAIPTTAMRGTDNAALASGVNATQIEGGDATDAIQAAATAALVAANLDHLVVATGTVSAVTLNTGTATTVETNLTEADGVYESRVCVFVGGDASGAARVVSNYVNASGAVTMTPGIGKTVSIGDTFVLLNTLSPALLDEAVVGLPVLTAGHFASNCFTVAKFADGFLTAAKIASNAITAAKVADGTIDAATFAAGAITASAIAADAIGASELAADAVAEIIAAWAARTPADDEGAAGHGSYAQVMALLGGAHKVTITDDGDDTATIKVYKADGSTQWGSNLGATTAASGDVITGAEDTAS